MEWTDDSKPGPQSLREFTVRITRGTQQGTGFFVSPGLVLTCRHVVAKTDIRGLKVFWRGSQDPLPIRETRWPTQDVECYLAVIEVELSGHPCVRLDENESYEGELGQESSFYSFGFPAKRTNGDTRTLSFEGSVAAGGANFVRRRAEPGRERERHWISLSKLFLHLE